MDNIWKYISGDFRQFLDVFGFAKLAHPGFPPWIPLRNSSISTEPPRRRVESDIASQHENSPPCAV